MAGALVLLAVLWGSIAPAGRASIAVTAGWLSAVGLPALLFLGGVVQLLLLPQLLAWAVLGPALGRAEASWPGVVLGAGLVAVVPAALLTHLVEGAPAVRTWLMVSTLVAIPRLACAALRPGAFLRPASDAA